MPEIWLQGAPLVAAPFIAGFLSVLVMRLSAGRGERADFAAWTVSGIALPWRHPRDSGGKTAPLYPALGLGATAVALWAVSTVPAAIAWWSCLLGWTLLALSAIDLRCWRLPNVLTYPLGGAGLVFAGVVVPERLGDHALGWVIGLAGIIVLNLVWRGLRGRDGLGWGDAKLLAAGGAWVGWAGLGGILFIAAVAALLAVLAFRLRGGAVAADTALPFGPALALGIWFSFLHGPLLIG